MAALDAKIAQRIAESKSELTEWMFLFWVGTLVPLGGLMLFLIR